MRDMVICYAEAQDPSLQRPFLGKRGVAALFFVLFIPHMIMCDDEAQKETGEFQQNKSGGSASSKCQRDRRRNGSTASRFARLKVGQFVDI